MKEQIGLLDCNNFFVSCERLFRPDLHKRPVVVLSSNDGCVVARSQEIKDMNIPMGVPYFQIKDILDKAEAVVFSGNITLYRDISRRVIEVIKREIEVVQQYSVDEAFFVVPPEDGVQERIELLKAAVEREVGVPVSIGVGFSKTQAKYASECAKKSNGLFVMTEDIWSQKVEHIPLEKIWGVGSGMAKKTKSYNLYTVSDYIKADPGQIRSCFGVVGARLQAELNGEIAYPLDQHRELQKSLMNSRSFAKTTQDIHVIADAVAYHARHVAAELRAMKAACSTMRVSLQTSRHGDFFLRGGSKEVVFTAPTNATIDLVTQAQEAIQALFEPNVPYQKVGVMVSGIVLQDAAPATLFADAEDASSDIQDLYTALDLVNNKAGRELLTVGSRLQTKAWQAKAEKRSALYTTRWSDVVTVSAKHKNITL